MPDYRVIADAGETLISLLRENLNDLIPNPDEIVLISPGEIESNDTVRLSLFLYQVIENIHLKNQEMEKINSAKLRYPPLVLDLYYMLTSYPSSIQDRTERTKDEHTILGRAMRVFNDNGILTGSALKGSLATSGEELHITLHPTSLDDITKIWNTFQGKPLRPSACYLVTPVNIDSTREMGVQRVVSKETSQDEMVPGGG